MTHLTFKIKHEKLWPVWSLADFLTFEIEIRKKLWPIYEKNMNGRLSKKILIFIFLPLSIHF